MFNRFHDITTAVYDFRHGNVTVDELATIAGSGRLGRTPNPNRICTIVMMYNMAIPFIEAFDPGLVLPPMPVPPQCLPTPTADPTEASDLLQAVFAGLTD